MGDATVYGGVSLPPLPRFPQAPVAQDGIIGENGEDAQVSVMKPNVVSDMEGVKLFRLGTSELPDGKTDLSNAGDRASSVGLCFQYGCCITDDATLSVTPDVDGSPHVSVSDSKALASGDVGIAETGAGDGEDL